MIENGEQSLSYTITVTGTVNDVSSSDNFILTIENPCFKTPLTRIIGPTSLDPDYSYTYYIGST